MRFGSARIGDGRRRLSGVFRGAPYPDHSEELVAHNCINMRQTTAGGLYVWEFERESRPLRVRVEGQLTFNSSYPMVDAAISGLGVGYIPE